MRKKISLKFILLISFIIILFTMTTAYTVISYSYTHRRLKSEAYKILYNYTDLSTKALEDRIDIITNTFHAIENSPEFMSFYNDISKENWTSKMNSYIQLDNYITNIYYENYDYLDSIFISIEEPQIAVSKRHELFTEITFNYTDWWQGNNQDPNHYQWSYSPFNPIFKTHDMEDTITLFRFIGDSTSKTKGTIMFNIKKTQFSDILLRNSLYEDGYFFILDNATQTINFSTDSQQYPISLKAKDRILQGDEGAIRIDGDNQYAVVYTTLHGPNWKLCYVIPESTLFKNYKNLMSMNYAITLLILIPAIALTIFIIRKVTLHINTLIDQAQTVEQGELAIDYQPSPLLEIDILNNRFHVMATKINELLHNIKLEKEKEKELELALLQAQINPHFLYNTLYSLKQQCLMEGSVSSAKLIQALSDFYRISLSKGSNLITIEKEIEHIKSYIQIEQNKMAKPFNVVYDIDPYLLNENIVKLSLQPLVENAIQHGIKNSRIDGIIKISCKPYEHYIGIEIEDNGCGIAPDILNEIKKQCNEDYTSHAPFTHYGLTNVNHRLKLYFGKEYGLDISSSGGNGTTIMIKLPYGPAEEETYA